MKCYNNESIKLDTILWTFHIELIFMWKLVNDLDETCFKTRGLFCFVFYHGSLTVVKKVLDLGTPQKQNYTIFVRLYMRLWSFNEQGNTNSWEQYLKNLATCLNFILSRKHIEILSLGYNFLTLGFWGAFKNKSHIY